MVKAIRGLAWVIIGIELIKAGFGMLTNIQSIFLASFIPFIYWAEYPNVYFMIVGAIILLGIIIFFSGVIAVANSEDPKENNEKK